MIIKKRKLLIKLVNKLKNLKHMYWQAKTF